MKECGRMLKAIGAPDAPKTSRNVKTISVVRVRQAVVTPDLCSSTSAFYFRTLFLLMYFLSAYKFYIIYICYRAVPCQI